MTETYQIAEIFESINGEGRRAGELAVFVRMKGCNLRCGYCDTKWANEPDAPCERLTLAEVLDRVLAFRAENVTLTGGEPLLQEGIAGLLKELCRAGKSVEVETNGSVLLEPFCKLSPSVSFTMDYKLGGSGMEGEMRPENFPLLSKGDTVKFVVAGRRDLERAFAVSENYLHGMGDNRPAIYLSPVFGQIEPKEIVEFMKETGWVQARLQLQLHKLIWDPEAKGV